MLLEITLLDRRRAVAVHESIGNRRFSGFTRVAFAWHSRCLFPDDCGRLGGHMPIRVLVVDDDADFQWLIQISLQMERDTKVVGGETGVALARREQPDVVVMDLMMPHVDGLEATKRIKRILPAVKIFAVSSYLVDNAMRDELFRTGVDAILGKRDIATSLVPTIRSLHNASVSPEALHTRFRSSASPKEAS